MQLKSLTFRHEPTDGIAVWAQHDHHHRTLEIGYLRITHIPVEEVDSLHAALATALNKPCRPRTYDEIMGEHTRQVVDLITPSQVWTLAVVDDADTPKPAVSVHRSEQDAEDALRANYAPDRDDLVGKELIDEVELQGLHVSIEQHTL